MSGWFLEIFWTFWDAITLFSRSPYACITAIVLMFEVAYSSLEPCLETTEVYSLIA